MKSKFSLYSKVNSLFVITLLGFAPVPFISGCKDEGKGSTQATLPTVQINPIVVLKSGEQIGDPANGGCRLSRAQMTDHLRSLNDFAKVHWSFQIAYPTQGGLVSPLEFEDVQLTAADLPFGTGARRYPVADWLFSSLPAANNLGLWNGNKVNIFFTGNVQVDPQNATNTRGNTVDPGDAQGAVVRHIFINDLGFVFDPPKTELGWNVLPHEFCHYLIRQKGPAV